jgi:DNA recombination protein RmuC
LSGALVAGAVLGLVAGLALGLLFHVVRRARPAAEARASDSRRADAESAAAALSAQLEPLREELSQVRTERAVLAAELAQRQRAEAERAAAWDDDRERLRGTFSELSRQALQANNEQFLALAESRLHEARTEANGELAQRQQAIDQLLAPLRETLSRYEQGLRQLELDRQGAYSALHTQVSALGVSHDRLQKETRNLVTALRAPQTRGRWGEVQLRRVVEMAGMVAHCDFTEQVTVGTDGGRVRPDLVVHLPGGAEVVVDAKVALDAYLSAAETEDDDARRVLLANHARQLRTHVDQLAKKEYWGQFETSPELVVAFIPGDPLLAAAFEHDPGLVEHALANRVLLATPTTLVALLRTIAFGWRQEDLAVNARQVQQMAAELYDRLRVLGGHLSKLHRNLTGTVEAYNEAVGSLESRVLVTARRFAEMGVEVGGRDLPEAAPVTATPRLPLAPEPHSDIADGPPSEPTNGRGFPQLGLVAPE